MPAPPGLPEQLVLKPPQPAPLPWQWHFTVEYRPGFVPPRRDGVVLFVGQAMPFPLAHQDQLGTHGFSKLLDHVLGEALTYGLWGQSVKVQAAQTDAGGNQCIAVSNSLMLPLPISPIALTSVLRLVTFPQVVPPAGALPPGGRLLYYRCAPSSAGMLPSAWYLRQDTLRLEDSPAGRSFDRFTWWLAHYAVPPKQCGGVTSGELLAQRLGALKHPKAGISGTLAQLCQRIGPDPNQFHRSLLWTTQRVIAIETWALGPVMAWEMTPAGAQSTPIAPWLATQNMAETWQIRQLPPLPHPPYGVDSLP